MGNKLYEMVESFCATERILELIGYILVDKVTKKGEPYWDIVEKESKIKVGSISRNKDKDKYYVYVYDSPIIDWNQNIPEKKHFLYDSKDRHVLNFGFKNRCGVIIASGCAFGETHDNDMLFVNIKKDDETIGLIQIYFNKGIKIQFMSDENDSKFKQSLEYSCGIYKLEEHVKISEDESKGFTIEAKPLPEKPNYTIVTATDGKMHIVEGTVEDWARTCQEGQNVFARVRAILNNLFPFDDEHKNEDVLSTIVSKRYIEENGLSVFFGNDEKTKNGISYEKSLD